MSISDSYFSFWLHSVQQALGSSTSLQLTQFLSFLWMSNIPLYICTTSSLFICWWRKWQSTPVLLPGKSRGQRSLVGYSPWGRKESDTTEWLRFIFIYVPHLPYSSVDGHLDCFYVLAIVNSAAMNIRVHVSFWIMVFSGYMPSCEIVQSVSFSSLIRPWCSL